MYEWNEMVQLMIDWIDNNLTSAPSLLRMSNQLGYSPYYCTKRFHSLTGMTLRDYVWMRRISRAALELRDSHVCILDVRWLRSIRKNLKSKSMSSKCLKRWQVNYKRL